MATYSYSNERYQVVQCAQLLLLAGTANTEANKFVAFADVTIHNVYGAAIVAGTDASAGWHLNVNGTDSQGFLTAGQVAADGTYTAVTTDITLSKGDTIAFDRIATEGATMEGVAAIEFSVQPGAALPK